MGKRRFFVELTITTNTTTMAFTGKLLFGASENSADMLYLTGFSAPDPFLWLEVNGRQIIIINSMEQERARKQCRHGIEVYT
ncbi:MAG: hypothetical protein IKR81_02285, partial [Victivallales bacterium]|nr:hypothetical protein [Victivallales bacterium]